jgi:dTDP-4-amino-4,6-dideoxygalactose transaminase
MASDAKPFLPFALPDVGEEEISGVLDSLRSGWLTTGPKTRQFEKEFGEFLGGDVQAIAVNSATAGLHLALEALGISAGDEVITTTYTFTATAEIVRYLGADPIFVDIDSATLNLDVNAVERAITQRTKAIIPVHFAGLACDMSRLLSLASSRGIGVVEDAAHAFPASHRGHLIGTMPSEAAVFSFYATKTITTGEGGMIVMRDDALARRCRTMRLHGIDRDAFDRYSSKVPAWYYEVVAPGFKYNMTDLAASLGIAQLRKAHAFQRRRAELAARYDKGLKGLPVRLPPRIDGDVHAWHLYVIQICADAGVERGRFIERMAELGIGCSVHFIPLHLHPYWRDRYRLSPQQFPVAQRVYEHVVSLPLYTRMTDEDQHRVIAAVRESLGC